MTSVLSVVMEAAETARNPYVGLTLTMAGEPAVAAVVRRTVRALAPHCPRLDDLVQIASELVASGILFPGPDDNTIELSISLAESAAEITVTQDVPTPRKSAAGNAFGRTVHIVMGIADACRSHTRSGRTKITAEVKW